jgi:DNA-binding LacI/PurR family transcriptional regulator
MKRTTIKDVARRAGVSIATVSRVINENYFVSPTLKRKVIDAVNKTGYYPNSIARSLKFSSTFTIGFIVFNISNKYFMTMAKSIEDIVGREHYNLIVCSTEGIRDNELLHLRNLASKKVDGLIITSTGGNEDTIVNLSRSIPTVLLHRRLYRKDFIGDFVDSNNTRGAYDLTQHLIDVGHEDIAVVNGPQTLSSAVERYIGYKNALKKNGIDVNHAFVYEGDYSFESGHRGIEKIMETAQKPTAVVIMSHEMTLGALTYIREHDISVPERLSIVAYGNIENIDLLYIRPTIVTQEPEVLGKNCAECILQRIKNRSLPNKEIIYEPKLVQGNSVRFLER